jgi:SAM-dependent methyltransferase
MDASPQSGRTATHEGLRPSSVYRDEDLSRPVRTRPRRGASILYADLSPRLYDALQNFVHQGHEFAGRALRDGYDPYRPGPVLDLGCGTGKFSKFFEPGEYVGCDIDAGRIESARENYPGHEFLVADATELQADFVARFSFVFCHAWVHHIDDEPVRRILDRIAAGGRRAERPIGMLIFEPILPDRPLLNPLGYLLAKLDRGRFVRPDRAMRSLFEPFLLEAQHMRGPWRWPLPFGVYRLTFGETATLPTGALRLGGETAG